MDITTKAPSLSLVNQIVVLFALLAIVVLESILREFISLWGVAPAFLLASVVYLALQLGPRTVVGLAFAGGLILDLFSYHLLGSSAFALCIIGWLVGLMRGMVFRQNLLLYLAMVSASTFLFVLITNIINLIAWGEGVRLVEILWQVPLSCLLNFLAFLLLLPLVRRLLRGRLDRGK